MATDPGVAPNDMISSFFFADPSGQGLTWDQLKQRRAVAAALASRARPYPTTIGQGIASAGESFSNAMFDRQMLADERRAAALGREFSRPLVPEEPRQPATPSGGGSASVDPAMVTSPASLTAGVDPAVDAGRSEVAARASRMPVLASAYAGTGSDAGSAGLTYAGPGGAIAEPPDRAAPDQSIENGRNAVASTMVAQLGGGRPGAAAAPGGGAPAGPAGRTVAPPETALQRPAEARPGGNYPAPGEIRVTPPVNPGADPDRPRTGVDTPAMTEIKRRLVDPRFQQVDPVLRERALLQLNQLKEARDKQDAITIENWQKKRDEVIAARRKFEEDTQSLPKRQQEMQESTAKNVRIQRFGSENLANEAEKATSESWKANAPSVRSLRETSRIKATVDQMFSGAGAEYKLQGAKILDMMDKLIGQPGWFQNEIQATEAFKGMIATQVATVLKGTVGSQGISNADREFAERAAGGNISLDGASIKRILDITHRMAINNVKDHNEGLNKTFDDPTGWDRGVHKRFSIEMPQEAYSSEDLMHLQATPNSPQERARFDEIYGKGSARRVLGYGR